MVYTHKKKIASSDLIKINFYDWSLIFNIGQLLIVLFVKSSPFREIALINSPSIKYWKAIAQPSTFCSFKLIFRVFVKKDFLIK